MEQNSSHLHNCTSNSVVDIPSTSSSATNTSSLRSSPIEEINAKHYKLILQGDGPAFSAVVRDPSLLRRNSDMSTILHIAASAPQSGNLIEFIVRRSPELLMQPDSKGDLPIHVAARAGHVSVVRNLLDLADRNLEDYRWIRMLEQENNEKNTALHIALENQQKDMASMLYDKCSNTINSKNKEEMCPMFLAIKARFWELVENMLSNIKTRSGECTPQQHPVLHAIIIAKNIELLKKILDEGFEELIYTMDEKGRRPLSYAAYIGFLEGVKTITKSDYSNQAFKPDGDGSFPIHSACRGGDIRVVNELLRLSGNMVWLLNGKKQNILHVAAQSGKDVVVEYLLRKSEYTTMINMKDEDGHTPLHLGVIGKNPKIVYILTLDIRTNLHLLCNKGFTALDIAYRYDGETPTFAERLTWLVLMHAGVPRAPKGVRNEDPHNGLESNGKITIDVIEGRELRVIDHRNHKRRTKYKDRVNTLLIISALVATVTYATGFTIPGGYDNSDTDAGMAILDHKLAFQVFLISSAIAMHTSVLAIVALIWAHLDDVKLAMASLDVALPLLGTSLVTMSVAFVAGVHVALDGLIWLRIVLLVLGGFFLIVFFIFFIPLYSPWSCAKCKLMRYVSHIPFQLLLLANRYLSKSDATVD